MPLLSSKKVLTADIEVTYQLDAEPVVSADEVLTESVDMSFENLVMLERPAVRASLGKLKKIYAGSLVGMEIVTEIKGSGSAGVAPEIGKLLRMCGIGETIVGGTSVTYAPVSSSHESGTLAMYNDGLLSKIFGVRGNVSFAFDRSAKPLATFTMMGHQWQQGTVAPGPGVGSLAIRLANNFSQTDDIYNGMKIKIIQGTGLGQERTISDYIGVTNIAIISVAWVTDPDSTSIYAILGMPLDVALPTATYDSSVPSPFIGMDFKIDSYGAVINAVSMDLGNEVTAAINPNSVDGYGEIRITSRAPTGSLDPEKVLIATHDFVQRLRDGNVMALQTGSIGSTAGNIINFTAPAVTYTDVSQSDRDGIATLETPIDFAESSGDDDWSLAFT